MPAASWPRESSQRFSPAFLLEALARDFSDHGKAAIEALRESKPDAYLATIAKLVPKELLAQDREPRVEDLSDEELLEICHASRRGRRTTKATNTS